jgi:predicted transcriptional regulator
MGTLELKNVIAQYMSNADDTVLKIVKAVFETYEKDNVESEIEVPEVFHKLIERGLEDSKAGRIRSHEDVMADVKKRYNIAG